MYSVGRTAMCEYQSPAAGRRPCIQRTPMQRTAPPTAPRCPPAPQALQVTPRVTHHLRALAMDAGSYDECDENFGEYCSLGPDGRPQKLSIGEKERLLLQCSAAHARGLPSALTDPEYDNLKEELLWQGSTVSLLSPEELMFLESERFVQLVLSDEEYDALKTQLQQEGSSVVVRGPRCSLRSRKAFADTTSDDSPGYLLTGFVFAVVANTITTAATTFGITDAIGDTLSWALALPFGYLLADIITQAGLKRWKFMKADCPSCGKTVRTVVAASSGGKEAVHHAATCGSCSSHLDFRTEVMETVLLKEKEQ